MGPGWQAEDKAGSSRENKRFMQNYRAPLWLPGGHLQTIWPALYGQRVEGPAPRFRRERWDTPDGDFIDVDWLQDVGDAPAGLLVLFHGLKVPPRANMPRPTPAGQGRKAWPMPCPTFAVAAAN